MLLFKLLLKKKKLVPFMLLSIDPVVCTVHAYDTKHSALHGRNVRVEQSVALKQRAAVSRDGEWVCAVVHVMC